jgi:transposase
LPESFAPGKVTTMTWDELVASNAALSGEVRRSHEALKIAQLTIDKMKVELAYLRRMKYGRSSERLEQPQPQLELVGGQTAPVAGMPSTQAERVGMTGRSPT